MNQVKVHSVQALTGEQKFTSGVCDVIDALLEGRGRAGSLDVFMLSPCRREAFQQFLGELDSAVEALIVVWDDCDDLPEVPT